MNEDELRATLRQGAGETPDADSVVAAARGAATRRRVRLLSTASSVAVVAAIAVTVGVLATGHDDPPPAGRGVPVGPPSGATSTGPPSTAPRSIASCPTGFPMPIDSLGDSTGRELPAQPASIEVCAYGSTGSSARPASLTLTGTDAARITSSLNQAPTTRPQMACPLYRVADDHRLAFLVVAADSSTSTVVTTLGNPTCSVVVSTPGGTRYAWAPPADLAQKILALR